MSKDVPVQVNSSRKLAKLALAAVLAVLALLGVVNHGLDTPYFLAPDLPLAVLAAASLVALVACAFYLSKSALLPRVADGLVVGLTLTGVSLIYQQPEVFTIWLPLLLLTPILLLRGRNAWLAMIVLSGISVLLYAVAAHQHPDQLMALRLLILAPLSAWLIHRCLETANNKADRNRAFVTCLGALALSCLLVLAMPMATLVDKAIALIAALFFTAAAVLFKRFGEDEWLRLGYSLLLLLFYSITTQLGSGYQVPGLFLLLIWLFMLLPAGEALMLGIAALVVSFAGIHGQHETAWHPVADKVLLVSALYMLVLFVIFRAELAQAVSVRQSLLQLVLAAVIVMPVLALLDFQSLLSVLKGEFAIDWYLSKAFVAVVIVWLVARLFASWQHRKVLQEELDISSTARNWALDATDTVVIEVDLETGFANLLGGSSYWSDAYGNKPLLTLFADFLAPEDFEEFCQLQSHPYSTRELTILDPNNALPAFYARLSFSQPYTRRGRRYQMLYRQDITAANRLRIEAQSALAKLESLTETLGIGVFEHDLITDRYSANASWREMRDLPVDLYPEIDLMTALKGVPAEDLEAHREFIKAVHTTGGVQSRVQRLVHSNGKEVWLKVIVKPILKDGRMVRVVGCNVDVTEQIEQQRVLEGFNAQQSKLLKELKDELITNHLMGQVAGLGRFTYNPREKTLHLSAEAQNLFGIRFPNALFSDLVSQCTDKDAHLMVSFANRIGLLSINYITTGDVEAGKLQGKVRGSQIESEPVELLDAEGRSRWVKLIAASYQLDNEPVDIIGCVLDVTDEAREQRKSEDRFYELKKAAEAANIHVYEENLTTSEGMLITDPTRYPTGTSTPLVGAQLRSVVPADYRLEVDRFYETVGYIAEFPIDLPNGKGRIWFKQQVVRRFKRAGAERAVVIAIDVTSEHQIKALLEASLNESEALIREMKEQRERQRRMFAVIGHELRTPAATLRMLLNEQEVTQLKPHGAEIDDVTNHLLAVLDDLRSVVRPEGSEIGEISEDNPEKLLQRALGPLKALFSEHRLDTHINVSKVHYTELSGNYQALRQIITNLAKNSALYSGASDLWVSASTRALEDERVMLEVRVEDNGKGVAPEVLERLFSAFARGESDKDGTGLGLFISRDLARKMGGDVVYADREGGGACFILTAQLRLPGTKTVVEAGPKKVSEALLEGKRVLVAEDNKMLQMLTRKLLEKLGAEVEVAENGQVALERAEVADFDLLMSDIFMPEMDGYALARMLRKRDPHLPIIGVSAATIGEETDQMLASGADRVIAKPLSVEALLSAYAEILLERAADSPKSS